MDKRKPLFEVQGKPVLRHCASGCKTWKNSWLKSKTSHTTSRQIGSGGDVAF